MALIACPECNKQISNSATSCPHCGFPLQSDVNQTISTSNASNSQTCPQKTDSHRRKKKSRTILSIILAAVMCISACAVLIVAYERDKANQEAIQASIDQQLAEESRLEQERLEAERLEQERLEQEKAEAERLEQERLEQERLAKEKARLEYIDALKNFSLYAAFGCVQAADTSRSIVLVWYDSIYHVYSEETAAYTQTNGKFNEDFNVSLQKLLKSEGIIENHRIISENKAAVDNYYKQLLNPTKEFEECYDLAKKLYQSYYELTMLALMPSGSLNSYSETRTKLIEETAKFRNELELLIPQS